MRPAQARGLPQVLAQALGARYALHRASSEAVIVPPRGTLLLAEQVTSPDTKCRFESMEITASVRLSQPIVHIASNGTASFGSATVQFGVDYVGKAFTTVTNVVLP